MWHNYVGYTQRLQTVRSGPVRRSQNQDQSQDWDRSAGPVSFLLIFHSFYASRCPLTIKYIVLKQGVNWQDGLKLLTTLLRTKCGKIFSQNFDQLDMRYMRAGTGPGPVRTGL